MSHRDKLWGGGGTLLGREENNWPGSDRTGSLDINNALCSMCMLIEFPLLQYFSPATNANFSMTQQGSTIRWTDVPGQVINQIKLYDQFMKFFCSTEVMNMHAVNHIVKCICAEHSCQFASLSIYEFLGFVPNK